MAVGWILRLVWVFGAFACKASDSPGPVDSARVTRSAENKGNSQDERAGQRRWWKRTATQVFGVRRMWGASPNDVWAVGVWKTGGAVHRWDGHEWRTVYQTKDIPFGGIWGSAADDVWITGARTVLHWDGERFSEARIDERAYGQLWGTGRDDVWMAGPPHSLLRFRGASWELSRFSEPPPPERRDQLIVRTLWGTGPQDVWAAGERGLVLRFDGSTWRRMDTGVSEGLIALWGVNENDVWAAGSYGTVIHWDGKRWSTIPFPPARNVEQLWGESSQVIWVSTDRGVFRWEGREWSKAEGIEPSAIWVSGADDVWVAERKGFLHLTSECGEAGNTSADTCLPFVLTKAAPERRAPDTSAEAPPTEAEARAFVRDLLEAGESGDVSRWNTMLSWKRRVKMAPEMVTLHMTAWHQLLTSRKSKLEGAQFHTERFQQSATLRFSQAGEPDLVLRVTREDGALRFDEN